METIMLKNTEYVAAIDGVISAVNVAISVIEAMYEVMSWEIDTSYLEGAGTEIDKIADKTQGLNSIMEVNSQLMELPELDVPADIIIQVETQPIFPPESVSIPVLWETGTMDIFTGKGGGKFRKEAKSVKAIMEGLYETQEEIADLLPLEMFQGAEELTGAIDELGRIQLMTHQTLQRQNDWNAAVGSMNLALINKAFLQLAQTNSNIGNNIQDNVQEQVKFNVVSQQNVRTASTQKSIVLEMLDILLGQVKVGKAIRIIANKIGNGGIQLAVRGLGMFEGVLATDRQLMSALAARLDDEYVINYMLQSGFMADTSKNIEAVGGIQGSNVSTGLTVETRADALQKGFNNIIDKASEIQSKGAYKAEVMILGATELTNYFSDPNAIEMMMEPLADYAMKINGPGQMDAKGMVSYADDLGKLRAGETMAMPGGNGQITDTQQAIIGGTATEEQVIAALGQEYLNLSEDMRAAAVIAQILQNTCGGLYEEISNSPQGQIMQMRNNWVSLLNVIGEQLYPCMLLFANAILGNSGTIQNVLYSFLNILQNIVTLVGVWANGFMRMMAPISEILPIVLPILLAIIAAYTTLAALTSLQIALEAKKEAANMMAAGSTFLETAAQHGLNAALAACPITWIVLGVIALIAILLLVCQVIANVTGIAESAFGIICGAVMAGVANFVNTIILLVNTILQIVSLIVEPFIDTFERVLNVIHGGFDGLGGAVANLIGSIISWFLSLGKIVTKIIDAIFGTDWTSGLNDLQDTVLSWGKTDNAITLDRNGLKIDYRMDPEKAFENGAAWGDGVSEKIGDFDLSALLGIESPEELEGISAEDYVFDLENSGMSDNLDNIATDTGAISDSMDVTQEDLKYLRDIAEQESINKYTLAEVKIEQTNHNNVSSGMDLDGVVSGLTDAVNEAVDIVTEGVHA